MAENQSEIRVRPPLWRRGESIPDGSAIVLQPAMSTTAPPTKPERGRQFRRRHRPLPVDRDRGGAGADRLDRRNVLVPSPPVPAPEQRLRRRRRHEPRRHYPEHRLSWAVACCGLRRCEAFSPSGPVGVEGHQGARHASPRAEAALRAHRSHLRIDRSRTPDRRGNRRTSRRPRVLPNCADTS